MQQGSNYVKIAVIDNGIDEDRFNIDIGNKVYVNGIGKCVTDDKDMSTVNFTHGTICAQIIDDNAVDATLYSMNTG